MMFCNVVVLHAVIFLIKYVTMSTGQSSNSSKAMNFTTTKTSIQIMITSSLQTTMSATANKSFLSFNTSVSSLNMQPITISPVMQSSSPDPTKGMVSTPSLSSSISTNKNNNMTNNTKNNEDALSVGQIVAIAVGCAGAVLLFIILIAAICLNGSCRKQKTTVVRPLHEAGENEGLEMAPEENAGTTGKKN